MKAVIATLILCLLFAPALNAKEKAEESRTKGWVDGKYVQLKTKETRKERVTKGWVDGEYVRIKEKKKKD